MLHSRLALLVAALSAAASANAAPSKQAFLGSSAPSSKPTFRGSAAAPPHHPEWDPLEHLSGIAPYHDAPGADIRPPPGCQVRASAYLIRHSSITANDDEWEDYMSPFVTRLQEHRQAGAPLPTDGPLAFLQDWQSPVRDDNLELLTKFGAQDATTQGRRIRKLHPHLFPPAKLGKKRAHDKAADAEDNVKVAFKIWAASSSRDEGTAKAWIRGAFPEWQRGENGEGDGKYVSLISVNNKDPDWSTSLTPHSVCKKFSKEPGKPNAREWLEHFGPAPLQQLKDDAPDFDWKLEDVVALSMLCGYESVIRGIGNAPFCKVFDHDTYKNFGYMQDLLYHKMVGYGSPLSPYLGIPWLNASLHNLQSVGHDGDTHAHAQSLFSDGDDSLPGPPGTPNSTHTQRLFVWFTHREEPPVALVALGLWNTSSLPTDRNPEERLWHTSHVLPFLGHVALERLTCGSGHPHASSGPRTDYIRAVVNGAVQELPYCHTGPGGACPINEFAAWAKKRVETYQDIEGACGGLKS